MSPKRNITIDALRGTALVVMAVDHLPHNGFNRVIDPYAGPFGFFTANSPFFFLAGLVCGSVYTSAREKRGHWAAVSKALKRARDLYIVNICLFIFLAFLGYHSEVWRESAKYFYAHPAKGFLSSLAFQYNFRFLDVLPLYCAFLAATPFAIAVFERGRAWLVFVPSIALWVLAQSGPRLFVDFGLNPLAFQLPFFTGLYLGSRYKLDSTPLNHIRNSRILTAVSAAACAVAFVARVIWGNSHYLHSFFTMHTAWFAQENQGPLRLLNFAMFAFLIWRFSPKIPASVFENKAVQWLALMGQHSLQVFAGSVLLADGFLMFMPAHPNETLRVIETVVTVSLLVVPAWLHREYARNPKIMLPQTWIQKRSLPI